MIYSPSEIDTDVLVDEDLLDVSDEFCSYLESIV